MSDSNKDEEVLYPGKIYFDRYWARTVVWVGIANEHLYTVLSDGSTFRLDRIENPDALLGDKLVVKREWVKIAQIPVLQNEDDSKES